MELNLNLLAKPNETIQTHTENIVQVGTLLLKEFNSVTMKLTARLPEEFFIEGRNVAEVKAFILEVLEYHDYGKINPLFQLHITKQKKIEPVQRKHAMYSFYIWLLENTRRDMKPDTLFYRAVIAFATIAGHHGSLKELADELKKEHRIIKEKVDEMEHWGCLTKDELKTIRKTISQFKKQGTFVESPITMFFCKYLFSLLVTSDSIASSELPTEEYEEIVAHLFTKSIQNTNFASAIHTNPIVNQPCQLDQFKDATTMNDLRQLLNKKSKETYEQEADIYILEAPVGTGKTLSSLTLADKVIHQEKKRKLISVFPLNSVQTQYVETLLTQLKLDETIMNVINSESLFGLPVEKDEIDITLSPNNLWLFERNCFANEMIVTSHVRFFQTVTSVSRKEALGFLNLLDAVVVIDEFQNYPTKYWFGIWNELLLLSELMGVKWIFTTGTFPVSETQLFNLYGDKIKKVLTKEENNQLFTSPFVKDRCELVWLNHEKQVFTENTKLVDEIVQDIRLQNQIMGRTQFIVCVSFVKQAKEMHQLIQERMPGYTCYFLCGRHNTPYKKELMKKIQEHHKHPEEKIILVTTKTVECGMDFDFDGGYKEFDMFDSVEQLSGRVNRSNKKSTCQVKLFKLPRKKMETEKYYLESEDVLPLLQEKEFILLYERMYQNNKITLKEHKDKMIQLNTFCTFFNYKEELTIIESTNYCTDLLLVPVEEEEWFLSQLSTMEKGLSYADHLVQSMKIRKTVEKYTMTVTANWLKKKIDSDLLKKEVNGITYYYVNSEKTFTNIAEAYCVNGVTSYLEKELDAGENAFEFY